MKINQLPRQARDKRKEGLKKNGVFVSITDYQGESGQMHHLKGTVGSDGKGEITISPNEMWR
jgi:hypothetical protein